MASPPSTYPNASAPTTDESATVAPTDRSTPRVTITSSWPIARTLMTDVWASTLPMFRVVRKTGSRIDRQTTSTQQHQHRAGLDQAHHQRQQAEAGVEGRMAICAARVGDGHEWHACRPLVPLLVHAHLRLGRIQAWLLGDSACCCPG